MKVIICIPTHSGQIESECTMSLLTTQALLTKSKIEHELFVLNGCPHLPAARNNLVAMFLNDPDATDLFFIDADLGFDAEAFLKILEFDEPIVGGIYSLKQDNPEYPVRLKTKDGVPLGRNGLLEAELIPTGFMRIKRHVFETMAEHYPELRYTESYIKDDLNIKEIYDFFDMGIEEGTKWTTEDYAFCNKWTKIGGTVWVYPDVDFSHVGRKLHKGNFHKYLMAMKNFQDELRNAELDTVEDGGIKGWHSKTEMDVLKYLASNSNSIIEVGCWKGRGTKKFLDNCDGPVYAVDNFKGGFTDCTGVIADENLHNEFMSNVGHYPNLIVLEGKSVDVANSLNGERADLIYLDAGHTYEEICSDIEAWLPRCNKIIAGHDYDNSFPGVIKAVNEKFKNVNIVDSIWWVELQEV